MKINDTKTKLLGHCCIPSDCATRDFQYTCADVEAKVSKKRPGYEIPLNSKGDHRLLAIVKFQDPSGKNNNCWDEDLCPSDTEE